MRFEYARQELLRGSARVTHIAFCCGFTHLGRFSVEYSRRYGEKPSQTLRRQAAFLAQQSPHPQFLTVAHDRPTIALVPIEANDRDQAVARGIAEELATALMRAGVAVTDRPEAARYHLRGTFRGDSRQARLTFRLTDAATARHIWAHRHDGMSEDILLFEERVAATIAAAMQPNLRAAEIDRARRKADTDVTVHDLTLRALPHVLALDKEGCGRALDLLERAMDRQPDHTLAIALAAWCHGQRVVYQLTAAPAEERGLALSLARRAIRRGGDAMTLAVLGHALTSVHDLEAADLVIRKALSLDGGSAWAWSRSAWIDVFNGHAESAMERFAIAIDLAPHDPLAFNNFAGLGCAHFHLGCYAKAAYWTERAIAEHPSAVWAHRTLCPAYVFGSRKPEAQRSLLALQRLYPDVTAARFAAAVALPQSYRDRIANGLESVGLRP
jgi:TolB-like protein/Flp pilus assembly protein TadD